MAVDHPSSDPAAVPSPRPDASARPAPHLSGTPDPPPISGFSTITPNANPPADADATVIPHADAPTARAADAPAVRRNILPGTVLDARYLIIKQIGVGGMGMVFLAEDQNVNNRSVAVKFILRELFRPDDYTLFCQEMQTIARLDQIQGVVKVIDSNLSDPERPYLVTDFIQGWNLETFVRDQTPTRFERVQLIHDICQTLHAVHDEGVLHRDLKPSNILVRQRRLGDRWLPVLVDFGLALYRTPAGQDALQILGGTPMFMSPEHASSLHQITRRSDVFSLGVILYWLLTEEYPYPKINQFDSAAPSLQPRPMPVEREDEFGVRVGVPIELARIVMKAISYRPIDRFQTAAEFADALRKWLHAERPNQLAMDGATIISAPRSAPGDAIQLQYLTSERVYSEPAALFGTRFNSSKIARFLGHGKTGLSFLATAANAEPLRIKVIYPAAKSTEDLHATLQRIAARTTHLRHPSIARIREVGRIALQDATAFYIATDYIDGKDILDWTADRGVEVDYGGYTARQLQAAFTLATTLQHAHTAPLPENLAANELGPFHGRICAANVIVNAGARPILTDFGLAWLIRSVAQPRAPRDRDCQEISTVADLEPFSVRHQSLAQREAHSLGQLLKAALFSNAQGSGILPSFKSPAEIWPTIGDALLNDLRPTLRLAAPNGPDAARSAAQRILAKYNQTMHPLLLASHLLRFLIHDLIRIPPAARLTDLSEAAQRIAEAASLASGATPEMLPLLRDTR